MPRGDSGRVVIVIDPDLKQELYNTLDKEGKKLKDWFLKNIEDYLSDKSQMSLFTSTNNEGVTNEVQS